MKLPLYREIITGTIVFSLAFSPVLVPLSKAEATAGDDYRFNYSNVLNSGILSQVIGCTGVVKTISTALTNLLNPSALGEEVADKIINLADGAGKATGGGKSGSSKGGTQQVSDPKLTAEQKKARVLAEQKELRESCLNGIAYNLAQRQIADITNKTVNWISRGQHGGDPLMILSEESYFSGIAKQEIRSVVGLYGDPTNNYLYPFGMGFARGIAQGARDIAAGTMSSTLNQYFYNRQQRLYGSDPSQKRLLMRDYGNNFSEMGGWTSWLLFTQDDANNPLGFNLLASNELSKKEGEKIDATKRELDRNGGYFDQRVCVEWDGKEVTTPTAGGKDIVPLPPGQGDDFSGTMNAYKLDKTKGFALINKAEAAGPADIDEGLIDQKTGIKQNTEVKNTKNTDGVGTCSKWKTVTPGSLIQSQANELSSTQIRQLMLADDINKSLQRIFTAELDHLMDEGLSTLYKAFPAPNQNDTSGDPDQGGGYANRVYDTSGLDITNSYRNSNLITTREASGWGTNDEEVFDITKDLGPHWQRDGEGKIASVGGHSVMKKGVIATQEEYVVNAANSMWRTWEIVPAIGELDYCLPGPNPAWEPSARQTTNASISFLKESYFDRSSGNIVTPDPSSIADQYAGEPGSQINGYDVAANVLFTVAAVSAAAGGPVGWVVAAVAGLLGLAVQIWGGIKGDEEAARKEAALKADENQFKETQRIGINGLTNGFANYYKKIEPRYGASSPMVTNTTGRINEFLPVAQSARELTKNVTNYYLNLKQVNENYKESIATTKSNIYRLKDIKKRVDALMLKAREQKCAAFNGTWHTSGIEKYKCTNVTYTSDPSCYSNDPDIRNWDDSIADVNPHGFDLPIDQIKPLNPYGPPVGWDKAVPATTQNKTNE